MQKKTLRTILIVIIIAIAIYQSANQDESAEPLSQGFPVTLEQPEDVTTIDTEEAEIELDTETPDVIEPALTPAETPDQFADLEEADGDFDFFVMALSWSPDYCASNNDPQQCSIGKKLDFVLHGLWPQYESGYPSYCSNEKMSNDLVDEFWGLYPSEKLFDHEWEKHGTCTGLTPEGYLLWSQELKDGLVIPAAFDSPEEPFRTDADGLEKAFIQDNPEFIEDSFAVYCSGSGRFMKELFVCFEKDGEPRACSDEILRKASKSCGQDNFLVRNTR